MLHLSLVYSPKIHSVTVKYLHQVKHVFVQNIFSQLVPHLGSWIKLKMIQGQLFMVRQWHFTLIIVECINKVFPQDILFLDQFKTSGSIFIHTALQNVVSNFLKIMLKMKNNYYEKLKYVPAWMLWGEMGQIIWCRKAQIINLNILVFLKCGYDTEWVSFGEIIANCVFQLTLGSMRNTIGFPV